MNLAHNLPAKASARLAAVGHVYVSSSTSPESKSKRKRPGAGRSEGKEYNMLFEEGSGGGGQRVRQQVLQSSLELEVQSLMAQLEETAAPTSRRGNGKSEERERKWGKKSKAGERGAVSGERGMHDVAETQAVGRTKGVERTSIQVPAALALSGKKLPLPAATDFLEQLARGAQFEEDVQPLGSFLVRVANELAGQLGPSALVNVLGIAERLAAFSPDVGRQTLPYVEQQVLPHLMLCIPKLTTKQILQLLQLGCFSPKFFEKLLPNLAESLGPRLSANQMKAAVHLATRMHQLGLDHSDFFSRMADALDKVHLRTFSSPSEFGTALVATYQRRHMTTSRAHKLASNLATFAPQLSGDALAQLYELSARIDANSNKASETSQSRAPLQALVTKEVVEVWARLWRHQVQSMSPGSILTALSACGNHAVGDVVLFGEAMQRVLHSRGEAAAQRAVHPGQTQPAGHGSNVDKQKADANEDGAAGVPKEDSYHVALGAKVGKKNGDQTGPPGEHSASIRESKGGLGLQAPGHQSLSSNLKQEHSTSNTVVKTEIQGTTSQQQQAIVAKVKRGKEGGEFTAKMRAQIVIATAAAKVSTAREQLCREYDIEGAFKTPSAATGGTDATSSKPPNAMQEAEYNADQARDNQTVKKQKQKRRAPSASQLATPQTPLPSFLPPHLYSHLLQDQLTALQATLPPATSSFMTTSLVHLLAASAALWPPAHALHTAILAQLGKRDFEQLPTKSLVLLMQALHQLRLPDAKVLQAVLSAWVSRLDAAPASAACVFLMKLGQLGGGAPISSESRPHNKVATVAKHVAATGMLGQLPTSLVANVAAALAVLGVTWNSVRQALSQRLVSVGMLPREDLIKAGEAQAFMHAFAQPLLPLWGVGVGQKEPETADVQAIASKAVAEPASLTGKGGVNADQAHAGRLSEKALRALLQLREDVFNEAHCAYKVAASGRETGQQARNTNEALVGGQVGESRGLSTLLGGLKLGKVFQRSVSTNSWKASDASQAWHVSEICRSRMWPAAHCSSSLKADTLLYPKAAHQSDNAAGSHQQRHFAMPTSSLVQGYSTAASQPSTALQSHQQLQPASAGFSRAANFKGRCRKEFGEAEAAELEAYLHGAPFLPSHLSAAASAAYESALGLRARHVGEAIQQGWDSVQVPVMSSQEELRASQQAKQASDVSGALSDQSHPQQSSQYGYTSDRDNLSDDQGTGFAPQAYEVREHEVASCEKAAGQHDQSGPGSHMGGQGGEHPQHSSLQVDDGEELGGVAWIEDQVALELSVFQSGTDAHEGPPTHEREENSLPAVFTRDELAQLERSKISKASVVALASLIEARGGKEHVIQSIRIGDLGSFHRPHDVEFPHYLLRYDVGGDAAGSVYNHSSAGSNSFEQSQRLQQQDVSDVYNLLGRVLAQVVQEQGSAGRWVEGDDQTSTIWASVPAQVPPCHDLQSKYISRIAFGSLTPDGTAPVDVALQMGGEYIAIVVLPEAYFSANLPTQALGNIQGMSKVLQQRGWKSVFLSELDGKWLKREGSQRHLQRLLFGDITQI